MGITERRQREKEKRLQSILETAEELIKSDGFSSFTLSKLSERIELSRGIIYYYFKNEENIIAKIIVDKMTRLFDRLNKIPQQESGFKEIKAINDEFASFLAVEPQYLTFITYFITGKIIISEKDSIPYYREYECLRDALFIKCMNAIQKGIDDGSIYPKIDPHIIAYCIWAGVGSFWEYMIKDNLLRPIQTPSRNPEEFIKAFFEIFYRGLSSDKT